MTCYGQATRLAALVHRSLMPDNSLFAPSDLSALNCHWFSDSRRRSKREHHEASTSWTWVAWGSKAVWD